MNIKHITSALIAVGILVMLAPTSFAEQTPAFEDVTSSHPNFEAIQSLKFNGVISGYPDGKFRPEQEVNRVEVLKMVFEGLELEDPAEIKEPQFSDVDLSSWYGDYLRKAYTLGMVEGYPDGTFKPAQTVIVVENLKIMLEAANVELETNITEELYNDTPNNLWYSKYVLYAKEKNLLEADTNNNIHPATEMTRADFAEALYRLRTVNQQGLEEFEEETEEEKDEIVSLGISINSSSFKPSSLTVGKEWKVSWTNKDSKTHTVTSDDGKFDSGDIDPGDTFEFTFNEEGTFDYHCEIDPSMTGTIVVKPANQVPTI